MHGSDSGGAPPLQGPTGLVNFPPDAAAVGPAGPRVKRVSHDQDVAVGAKPGDQAYVFGAVGEPLLQQIPVPDWSSAL